MPTHREKTEERIAPCRKISDDSIVLKEIAINLAIIADEIQKMRAEIRPDLFENAED